MARSLNHSIFSYAFTDSHLHTGVDYQVGAGSVHPADGGGLHRLAGAQGCGPHAEPMGTHAGGAVWIVAARGRRLEILIQRRSDTAARVQAAVSGGADDGGDL